MIANRHSAPARYALVFPAETFELDIENRGQSADRAGGASRAVSCRPCREVTDMIELKIAMLLALVGTLLLGLRVTAAPGSDG